MPVNSINVPHPADPDGTHDTRYYTQAEVDALVSGVPTHDPVTVTDTASVNLTLTGQDVTAAVLPAGVAHQSLSGAGTNTHAQIDTAVSASTTHIAASSAHGASGNIVGATTLAADIATHAAVTATHGSSGVIVGLTTLNSSIATHAALASTHGASGNIVGATTLAADIATHAAILTGHGMVQNAVGSTHIVSSTSAVAIVNMSFAIAASEIWGFDFNAITFMNTGTGGVKFSVTGPSGATGTTSFFGNTTSTTAWGYSKVALSTLTLAFAIYGTNNGLVRGNGVIVNSTNAGTVTINAAITGTDVCWLEALVTNFNAKRIS